MDQAFRIDSDIAFVSIVAYTTGMVSGTKLPTPADSEKAKEALRSLMPLLRKRGFRELTVKADGDGPREPITLPREALELFMEILGHMANGNTVTIVPIHAELTTQEAADMLNVSRPFLVGLLEERKIPYRLVGTHRRIKFVDLVAFKQADDAKLKEIADELTREAEKNKLGY